MYEEFYGLTGKPFLLNPDPKFFFESTGHKRAMAYMRYGLQQEQGFIVVTGDVGTGKSMLVSNLFKEIEGKDLVAAKIVSTNVKDVDLLRLISAEFDLPHERKSKAALLTQLEDFFRASVEDGKRVLLVIDEAQNMPRSAIEELRMLSNFEMDGKPLAQSFLLGQREFRVIMRAPGLEQLRQRVIAAYHLKPLSIGEVKQYIHHRLSIVGWNDDPAIDEEIYERIFALTSGVPRRINTLFDRLLLTGYLDDSHKIALDHLEAVRSEIEAEQGEDADEEFDVRPQNPSSGQSSSKHNQANLATNTEVEELDKRITQIQRTVERLSKSVQDLQQPREVHQPENGSRFPV
ncbi:MAG: XrtA/PEP-CTERM system-associated ATPase, partial [Pseudomonadota bacterium]